MELKQYQLKVLREFIGQSRRWGVLPLQFKEGFGPKKLNITGAELITVVDIKKGIKPRAEVICEIKYKDGTIKKSKY